MNVLTDLAPFIMVVAIVAIVFGYKIVHLMIVGRPPETKKERRSRKRDASIHKKEQEAADNGELAKRAKDMEKRLATLEEIMKAEEEDRRKTASR